MADRQRNVYILVKGAGPDVRRNPETNLMQTFRAGDRIVAHPEELKGAEHKWQMIAGSSVVAPEPVPDKNDRLHVVRNGDKYDLINPHSKKKLNTEPMSKRQVSSLVGKVLEEDEKEHDVSVEGKEELPANPDEVAG